MPSIFESIDMSKPPKKTLNDLLKDKSLITGKEAIEKARELERQKKQFEDSIEFEERNRRVRK